VSNSEETARELLALLPIINRIMVADLRQEVGEETTMPQFRVLAYLLDDPLTLSDIARRRRVSLQAAGELIQTLVDRGWIKRVQDPSDRRQMLLHLTKEGQEQYQRAHGRMLAHLIPFMEMLSEDEISAVKVALPALQRVLSRDELVEADTDDK
jgi:DNA-binding MarR family transcriptional regulator